jgi:Flavin containing amine oxidoreductase
VWSVPFAGATAERGAEFILPHDRVLIDTVRRLGPELVRKGTLYGNREPRGGEGVTREQIVQGLGRIRALPWSTGRPCMARSRAPVSIAASLTRSQRAWRSAVRTPARTWMRRYCGRGRARLATSTHTHTHPVAGGNDRVAGVLAEGLAEAGVRLSTPVSAVRWGSRGVRVRAGDDQTDADAAVVAAPPAALKAIEFDPPLPSAKASALSAARMGQAAKLLVALRTPAEPSAVLSVPERYWCYTQLGANGERLPFVAAFAGSPSGVAALEVGRGPDRWLGIAGGAAP